MSITNNIRDITFKIREYEKKYQRTPLSVSLLAASKAQSVDKIKEAISSGQKIFGENFLQEALPKISTLLHEDIEWHFIGHIQSNKTRKIAENFTWVHSVASPQIAKRLSEHRPETLPDLNICLEINVSEETSKSGVFIKDALALALYCKTLPRIKLRGLMAIPAPTKDFMMQRTLFHKLKLLFIEMNQKSLELDTLSMGMTEDMEAAIAEGSTLIRIGTGIFGSRLS
jgi:pyridoxal phosphate enzyme (YggS family)